METNQFDCTTCPGFCCSYDEISITASDAERIASHFDTQLEDCITLYTKYGSFSGEERYPLLLKHKHDQYFGTICTFFDSTRRACSIYEARPDACRAFPHGNRCGYYDFLTFERRLQGDDNHVALTG